jgi:hypothetical protein
MDSYLKELPCADINGQLFKRVALCGYKCFTVSHMGMNSLYFMGYVIFEEEIVLGINNLVDYYIVSTLIKTTTIVL